MAVKQRKPKTEQAYETFIAAGGSEPAISNKEEMDDHRLTLRIPRWLMARIDIKRKKRVGGISRNFYILEALERVTKEED